MGFSIPVSGREAHVRCLDVSVLNYKARRNSSTKGWIQCSEVTCDHEIAGIPGWNLSEDFCPP